MLRRRLPLAVLPILAPVLFGSACGNEPPPAAQVATVPAPPGSGDSSAEHAGTDACDELQTLAEQEKSAQEIAASDGDAGDTGGGAFGESRLAKGKGACDVADDNIQKLEDTVLAEADVAAGTPPPSRTPWNKKTPAQYFDRIDARFLLSAAERATLANNGFVVPDRLTEPSYGWAFHDIFQSQLPVMITADALMDAIFAGNDKLLVRLEQQVLAPALTKLLDQMACALPAASREWTADTARDVDLYLDVARLLESTAGDGTRSALGTDAEARAIYAKLDQAEGLLGAPGSEPFVLFGRPRVVDASMYRPRGHYANGVYGLQAYFRSAMWLSRLEFNLVSRSCKSSHPDEVPDSSETPREDLDALALAELVEKSGGAPLLATIDRAWGVLAGRREDVSMADLSKLRAKAGIASLKDAQAPAKLRAAIGDGWKRTARTHFMPQNTTELPAIAGMIGARIEPDSSATKLLVHDTIDGRFMLHAADMAYVLGIDRAKTYLAKDIADFKGLGPMLVQARAVATKAPRGDDLYGGWLDAIRGLAEPPAATAPSYMGTDAWRDMRMATTVTAFGELRHNYVLMAAGTYDAFGCEIPDGWVEPTPATLDALLVYADRGAKAVAVVDPKDTARVGKYFAGVTRVLRVLRKIVAREVSGLALTDAEKRFLGMVSEYRPTDPQCMDSCPPPTYTGWWYDLFIERIADGTADPSFIADYYTSTNAGKVAYIGARPPRLGVFVVDANGPPRAMVGPVAHGYEHVGSLDERLTDEEASALKPAELFSPWEASYVVAQAAGPKISVVWAPSASAKSEEGMPGLRVHKRGEPIDLDVHADKAIGPVTVELLDHHRTPVAAQSLSVGTTPTRFHFAGPRVDGAEGVRVRVGSFVAIEPGGFSLDAGGSPSP
jgi:hypothetical protein